MSALLLIIFVICIFLLARGEFAEGNWSLVITSVLLGILAIVLLVKGYNSFSRQGLKKN